jgi:hypothetical protein
MAALSPAESLFLLNPNRTPARETVKVTLLWLVAQGVVRLEERQVTRRFFGTRKAVHVRPAGTGAPALPAHAASRIPVTPFTALMAQHWATSISARSMPAHSTHPTPEWRPSMPASMPRSATAAVMAEAVMAEGGGGD